MINSLAAAQFAAYYVTCEGLVPRDVSRHADWTTMHKLQGTTEKRVSYS